MFAVTEKPRAILLSLAWLFPFTAHLLNFEGIGLGVFVPIAVAVWMGVSARRQAGQVGSKADGVPKRTVTAAP
jgi:hypothetical protein